MEYKILITATITLFISILIIRYFAYEELGDALAATTLVAFLGSLGTIVFTVLYIVWTY